MSTGGPADGTVQGFRLNVGATYDSAIQVANDFADSAEARAEAEAQTRRDQERGADAMEKSEAQLKTLVEAMQANLATAKRAQKNAELAEKHSRTISYSSLGIALASLAVAIVSIFLGR